MKNKLKSLTGVLAVAGALTGTGVETPTLKRPSIDESNRKGVTIVADFKAGDTNHYTLQSCTNLIEGAWKDSSTNTNVYNKLAVDYGFTNETANVYLYEDLTDSSKNFYRLKLNN